MKNLLCKLGFHKPSKDRFITVTRFRTYRGRGHGSKYHRNYEVCERCGVRLGTFAFKKWKARK